MLDERYPEIEGVIAFIHQHLGEPLSLAQLARYAGYSPYHFVRIFKEKMGISPHYYVSSLRLQKAKDLLLRTNLSVRDIGLEIGQQSLGTFTTRFTERVGVTPATFRNSRQQADTLFRTLQQLKEWESAEPAVRRQSGLIEGRISAAVPFEGVILIGLFPKPIPEGLPLYGTLLPSLGSFSFSDVKPGVYYIMATSVPWGMQAMDILLPHNTLRTRSHKPVIVEPYDPAPFQEIMLHPPRVDDPPILISLPLLMNNFLHRVRSFSLT